MNLNIATGILLAACLGCGCINVQVSPKQPGVVVVPGQSLSEQDSMAIAEIDAVFGLAFESSRMQQLIPIAQRPDLGPAAQAYLAAKTLRNLSFDNDKVQLLTVLIKNPAFSNAAKHEILNNLKRITFENNKTVILKALEDRGALVS